MVLPVVVKTYKIHVNAVFDEVYSSVQISFIPDTPRGGFALYPLRGAGFEPASSDNESDKEPLLYPAI